MADRVSKTSRILSTYHLFRYSEEVELCTLTDSFGVSKKTAYRDICALRRAGVLRVRFDKTAGTDHRGAFVPVSLELEPCEPAEGEPGRKFSEKIRRLCIFMAELNDAEYESPIELYRSLFPDRTDRTRQRDFQELRNLGYGLSYEPAFMDEPGTWSIGIPDAYALDTIPREMW